MPNKSMSKIIKISDLKASTRQAILKELARDLSPNALQNDPESISLYSLKAPNWIKDFKCIKEAVLFIESNCKSYDGKRWFAIDQKIKNFNPRQVDSIEFDADTLEKAWQAFINLKASDFLQEATSIWETSRNLFSASNPKITNKGDKFGWFVIDAEEMLRPFEELVDLIHHPEHLTIVEKNTLKSLEILMYYGFDIYEGNVRYLAIYAQTLLAYLKRLQSRVQQIKQEVIPFFKDNLDYLTSPGVLNSGANPTRYYPKRKKLFGAQKKAD
jgi:hypothetical protein